MNAKNYINFHVLISHSPSCLNRDDMNMQKTAIFGGVKRVRISSQSLKHALRGHAYYKEELGKPSIRTLKLDKLRAKLHHEFANKDNPAERLFDPALVDQALAWMSGKEAIADGVEADAVAPWSVEEVAYFCRRIREGQADGIDAKKLEQEIEKDSKPFRAAIGKSMDIALSGRMATSGLMTSLPVDGALAVAHAITTHAVEPQDVDWFTAVDDLKVEARDPGAGHLNTQEFSAGVFYRYASLNLKQLQVNLGLVDRIDGEETTESRQRALDIARHVLHMLATVVPTAKRQSFAADNPAEFAIVSFSDVPISLANGFEQPIERAGKAGGYLAPSERALSRYWERLNQAYGLDERAAAFCFDSAPWPKDDGPKGDDSWPKSLKPFDTLRKLEDWVARDGSFADDGPR